MDNLGMKRRYRDGKPVTEFRNIKRRDDGTSRRVRCRRPSVVYQSETTESTESLTEFEEEPVEKVNVRPRKRRYYRPIRPAPTGIEDGSLDELINSFGDGDGYPEPVAERRIKIPRNPFGRCELVKNTTYYRCNLQVAVKELGSIILLDTHLEILRCTPLWYPIHTLYELAQQKDLAYFEKNEEAIRDIMQRLDLDTESFYLGNVPVKLVKQDVQLILGVYGGSLLQPVSSNNSDYPPWMLRCFSAEIRRALHGLAADCRIFGRVFRFFTENLWACKDFVLCL